MKNQKSTIKTLNKNKKIKEVKIIENKIKQNIKDFKNFKITLNDNIFSVQINKHQPNQRNKH